MHAQCPDSASKASSLKVVKAFRTFLKCFFTGRFWVSEAYIIQKRLYATVHDLLREHAVLPKMPDKLDIAQGSPPGLHSSLAVKSYATCPIVQYQNDV